MRRRAKIGYWSVGGSASQGFSEVRSTRFCPVKDRAYTWRAAVHASSAAVAAASAARSRAAVAAIARSPARSAYSAAVVSAVSRSAAAPAPRAPAPAAPLASSTVEDGPAPSGSERRPRGPV